MKIKRTQGKLILLVFCIFLGNFVITMSNETSVDASSVNPVFDELTTTADCEWLLMIYFCGDMNLEICTVDSINELESTFIYTGEIEVLICIDRIPGYDQSNGNWTTTRYYHLQPDDDPMSIGSELLFELGETNMCQEESLRNFVSWANSTYTANKRAFMIMGHGGGLAGMGTDETNEDVLRLEEWQQAMDGFHFDLLVTESCGMGFLEVAYEFQTFVDYITFSQQPMWADSINYNELIEALCLNPAMEPWEFGDVVGSTFYYEWPYRHMETYSMVNCSRLAPIVSALTNVSVELTALLPTYYEEIQESRERMSRVFYYEVDIGTMIKVFKEDFPSETSLIAELDILYATYNDAILFNYNSRYSRNNTGLSLYFPCDSYVDQVLPQYTNDTLPGPLDGFDFTNNTLWDEFIVEYTASVENLTQPTNEYFPLAHEIKTTYNKEAEIPIIYGLAISEAGIYNITAQMTTGDVYISAVNPWGEDVFVSPYLQSYVLNPDQGDIEQMIHWLDPGFCLIVMSGYTDSTGTILVERIEPTQISLDQEVTGEFFETNGMLVPRSTHIYSELDLKAGRYQVTVDAAYPVGLEVEIYGEDNERILGSYYGISGANFTNELTLNAAEKIVIGFCSYTGSGSYCFKVTLLEDMSVSIAFYIIPLSLIVVSAIYSQVRKKK
ncbi:MAG: clostripain-related cysteine peptidase [Candidatus Heimdallarchaeota archaeon]